MLILLLIFLLLKVSWNNNIVTVALDPKHKVKLEGHFVVVAEGRSSEVSSSADIRQSSCGSRLLAKAQPRAFWPT